MRGAMRGEYIRVGRPSSKSNGLSVGRNHDASTSRESLEVFLRAVVTVQQSLRYYHSKATCSHREH